MCAIADAVGVALVFVKRLKSHLPGKRRGKVSGKLQYRFIVFYVGLLDEDFAWVLGSYFYETYNYYQ